MNFVIVMTYIKKMTKKKIKKEIEVWITHDEGTWDDEQGKYIPTGKMARFEDLINFFNETKKVSYGWETIEDSIKKGSKVYLDINCRIGNEVISKRLPLILDMFRKKKRGFW